MSTRRGEDIAIQTGDVAFASDRSLRIISWSRGAEELLGHKAEEVLGKPCSSIIRCSDTGEQPRCHAHFAARLKGHDPAPVPRFEHVLERRDGAQIPVDVTTVVVGLGCDRGEVMVHVLRDRSREREMERLLGQVATGAARLSLGLQAAPPPSDAPAPVTDRELDVLRLLAKGTATDAIAAELFISRHTARNHIQNILLKLDAHSRLEAVARARARGLL